MPIPPLDPFGLLPVGVYDCTVDEISERFGGASDSHRRDLFNGFYRWRSLLVRRNLPFELHVDGSFTTSADQPKDVDVAIRLPPSTRALRKAIAQARDLLDPDLTKPQFYVDPWYFFETEDGPDPVDYVRLFCGMRPEDAQEHGVPADHIRGILRVCP